MNNSAPLSHAKIEEAMRSAISTMERLTQDFTRICYDKAEAEERYKTAYAQARIEERMHADVDGRKLTVDMADDHARVATKAEFRSLATMEAKHDACRQALLTVRSQLEGFRSLLASYREIGA
jgi:hypothetical protein